jgi:hypothetical protein
MGIRVIPIPYICGYGTRGYPYPWVKLPSLLFLLWILYYLLLAPTPLPLAPRPTPRNHRPNVASRAIKSGLRCALIKSSRYPRWHVWAPISQLPTFVLVSNIYRVIFPPSLYLPSSPSYPACRLLPYATMLSDLVPMIRDLHSI